MRRKVTFTAGDDHVAALTLIREHWGLTSDAAACKQALLDQLAVISREPLEPEQLGFDVMRWAEALLASDPPNRRLVRRVAEQLLALAAEDQD